MQIDRRDFLRGAVGTGCALALGLRFFHFSDNPEARAAEIEQFVRSTCSPNCTGACGFKARVTGGRISTLIQAADYPEDSYNPRGCLRGLPHNQEPHSNSPSGTCRCHGRRCGSMGI